MGAAVTLVDRVRAGFVLGIVVALAVPSWVGAAQTQPGSAGSGGTVTPPRTLVGAGDISTCTNESDTATAELVKDVLEADPTAVAITMGDNVYTYGTAWTYNNCYAPTWGTFKARTRPVPGNHDFGKNTRAYFDYFGAQAGKYRRGYYRASLGTWRVYFLNSECAVTANCTAQYNWVLADLDANPHLCTMAVWHRARFSSGIEHGNSTRMASIFQLLYDRGAEVVLSGHDHDYERFAPLDGTGTPVAVGTRQFVAGLGGASKYEFEEPPEPGSEVRYNSDYGVLKMTLSAGTYSWEFVTVGGETIDQGADTCH